MGKTLPNRLLMSVWAKTDRGAPKEDDSRFYYHPLILHLIDVALAAGAIWDRHIAKSTRRLVETGLFLSKSEARSWVCLLAGMHDIGKCTPEFQGKVERLAEKLVEGGLPLPRGNGKELSHSLTGTVILKGFLERKWHMPRPDASNWATVVGGHHGIFPENLSKFQETHHPSVYGNTPWSDLREELIDRFSELFPIFRVPLVAPNSAIKLVMAGLISVADWLASNQTYFPCATEVGAGGETFDLAGYLDSASRQVEDAIHASGWRELPALEGDSLFSLLFPGKEARPSQVAIELAAKQLDGAAIVIVEMPTGEGKTEAALLIADRLAQVAGQRGIYFALPTQATSNQMFGRVCNFLKSRYAGVTDLPVILSHSHAVISPSDTTIGVRRGTRDTTDAAIRF